MAFTQHQSPPTSRQPCDLDGQKLQPVAVAEISAQILQRWCPLVSKMVADVQFHEACTDVMLLCFRDCIEAISDEDLVAGCRRRHVRSAAMEKVMQFLGSDDETGDE